MSDQQSTPLGSFIQLEKDARSAENISELFFIITNSTKKLINYHQAVLLDLHTPKKLKVQSVSGTANINYDAPFILWVTGSCEAIHNQAKTDIKSVQKVDSDDVKVKSFSEEWSKWSPQYVLYCPLVTQSGEVLGVLWLSRDQEWREEEVVVLEQLAQVYSHAWYALTAEHSKKQKYPLLTRQNTLIGLGVLLVILILPIRQSVLAPAEVVAQLPAVITSPVDGVIEKILVTPNQDVKSEQVLFALEASELNHRHVIANKALNVAQEKYRKAAQDAFANPESKAELALLKAQIEQRTAEKNYAAELLSRVNVKSPQSGVVIFSDPNDWIGKPVVIGEKVMDVASPTDKELEIWLPAEDAINLTVGSKVRMFLNVDPIRPIKAEITSVSYNATTRADGTFSYRIKAKIIKDSKTSRIGLKGTAKLYSSRVPVVYYLFWKPISALRRVVGL